MRRVVVTGVGAVSPLGCGNNKNWDALASGTSGIRLITRFDASDMPVNRAPTRPGPLVTAMSFISSRPLPESFKALSITSSIYST